MKCNEVTFQYISDLHLECYSENIGKIRRIFNIQRKADILLLAGDIGKPGSKSYSTFLSDMSMKFEKVYVIPGNHEYYRNTCHSMHGVDSLCKSICHNMPQRNVFFLQNDTHIVCNGLSIFGGTFWSTIPFDNIDNVITQVADYQFIPGFNVDLCNSLHQTAVSSLNNAIHASGDMKWIVMSHHIPQLSLVSDEYIDSSINCAFASNIAAAHNRNILAWVYGHTHKPKEIEKYYCNPFGYPGENCVGVVNKTLTVTL
jgi:predicted phosphodiesterase